LDELVQKIKLIKMKDNPYRNRLRACNREGRKEPIAFTLINRSTKRIIIALIEEQEIRIITGIVGIKAS